MAICVAVDANIIMSAMLGGKPSAILFDPRYMFVTTEFTYLEVVKYLPRLAGKLKLNEDELYQMLDILPLTYYSKDVYQEKFQKAKTMIEARDPKDCDILALALVFDAYLWSQDKDFDTCGYMKLLKTYHFIE